MVTPELAPRRTLGGIIAVWVAAVLIAVSIGIFVPAQARAGWLILGLGGCLLLSFAVQLGSGRANGFTERVAGSVLGAMVVMGLISAGFGLASIVPA